MSETNSQRAALARLVTYNERMIQSGKLSPITELNLRHFVDQTCAAFDMAPIQQDNISLEDLDRKIETVRQIVECIR